MGHSRVGHTVLRVNRVGRVATVGSKHIVGRLNRATTVVTVHSRLGPTVGQVNKADRVAMAGSKCIVGLLNRTVVVLMVDNRVGPTVGQVNKVCRVAMVGSSRMVGQANRAARVAMVDSRVGHIIGLVSPRAAMDSVLGATTSHPLGIIPKVAVAALITREIISDQASTKMLPVLIPQRQAATAKIILLIISLKVRTSQVRVVLLK